MKRMNVVDVMLAAGAVQSKSDARRAIAGRSVTINGIEITNFDTALEGEVVIRVGKQIERVVRVDSLTKDTPEAT